GVAALAARAPELVEVLLEQHRRAGGGAVEAGLAVGKQRGVEARLGRRILRGAGAVDAVRRERAQEARVDRVALRDRPLAPAGRGKVELRRLADDLHRQRVVVVESLGADADALLAQAGEDLAAAVSDAGDEAESGDDDSRGHSVR